MPLLSIFFLFLFLFFLFFPRSRRPVTVVLHVHVHSIYLNINARPITLTEQSTRSASANINMSCMKGTQPPFYTNSLVGFQDFPSAIPFFFFFSFLPIVLFPFLHCSTTMLCVYSWSAFSVKAIPSLGSRYIHS